MCHGGIVYRGVPPGRAIARRTLLVDARVRCVRRRSRAGTAGSADEPVLRFENASRQNGCRLDRSCISGSRNTPCGRRPARWSTRSVVHGKPAGARSASSTNPQPGAAPSSAWIPDTCLQQAGGDERTHWHDTDKHSKTERWRGCCHRRARRWTTFRVTLASVWARWFAGAVMR